MKNLSFLLCLVIILAGVISGYGQNPTTPDTIIHSAHQSVSINPYSSVVTNSGSVVTNIPLFNLPGKGNSSLGITLMHRSVTDPTLVANLSSIAVGWSHSGMSAIRAGTKTIQAIGMYGNQTWKVDVVQGTIQREPGQRDDLKFINGNDNLGGYEVTDFKTKTRYIYDRETPSGAQVIWQLGRVVDTFGNTVTYNYLPGDYRIDRITDASNRYVQFEYDPQATLLVKKIHLVTGSGTKTWTIQRENVGTFSNYLASIDLPSSSKPGDPANTPQIQFDSLANGNITRIRQPSGKLWGIEYHDFFPGSIYSIRAPIRTYKPWKTNPNFIDTSKFTTFAYSKTAVGVNGEFTCSFTDPEGSERKHVYWYQEDPVANFNVKIPLPIKRVHDPAVTVFTDPRNNQNTSLLNWWTTYYWDLTQGNCVRVTDRRGTDTFINYDTNNRGLVKEVIRNVTVSGLGLVQYKDTYTHYPSGVREGLIDTHTSPSTTQHASSVTKYEYDSVSGVLTKVIKDQNGTNVTQEYAYHSFGELHLKREGTDAYEIYDDYDPYGNCRRIKPAGRPLAEAITATFSAFNEKLTETKPSPSGTTTYAYDGWHRQFKTTMPDGKYTESTFNLDGNTETVRNENGSESNYVYTELGKLKEQVIKVDAFSANDLITQHTYNDNGWLLSTTAPDGNFTQYQHNKRGDKILAIYGDRPNEQWGYDAEGNTVWARNGRGQHTYYTYDQANRLTNIDYQSSTTPDVSYGYDPRGNRISMGDTFGLSTWTYDPANRLVSQFDAATNKTVTFGYVAGTTRNLNTVAPGNSWSNIYETGTTRLEKISQSLSGQIAQFTYNDDQSISRRTNPNNTMAEFSYDSRGRILSIRHAVDSLNQTQTLVSYTYENSDVKTYNVSITGGPSYATTYEHDDASRLESEIRTASYGAGSFNNQYKYTKGGDRDSVVRNGVTNSYNYNSNNRLLSGDGIIVNNYDEDGNPTSLTVNGQIWALAYDEESRLTQIIKSTGNSYFRYNGDGKRVERIAPLNTFRYLYVGDSVLLTTGGGSPYTIQAYYTPGIGYFQGGKMRFYQENALGSALVVRDDAGNFESFTDYDAYGIEYALQGTQKSDFRFAGKHGYQTDEDTGMDLLGARYYLPKLGRFLTQDPIGHKGGLNLYAYCENNPLSKIDPDGKQSVATPQGQLVYYRTLYEIYRAEAIAGGSGSGVLSFSRWVSQNAEPGTKFIYHHVLPQAYRARFNEIFKGDIIDKYLVRIPKAIHNELHQKGYGARGGWWNSQWKAFFEKNSNPTALETARFARELMRQTGIGEKLKELGPKGKG